MQATRAILATGDTALNRALAELPGLKVIAEIEYREALQQRQVTRDQVDVAIVSTRLPGRVTLSAAVLPLRLVGVRVIVVGPPLVAEDAEELILMGVYDLLTGDQPISRLATALTEAWTLGDALRAIGEEDTRKVARVRGRVLTRMRSFFATREEEEVHTAEQRSATKAQEPERERTALEFPPKIVIPSFRIKRSEPPPSRAIPQILLPEAGQVVVVLGRGGVGKTTVAAGLAAVLGGAGVRVAAIDAARPRPRLGYLLGAWQTSGFHEALQGAPLDWCVSHTPIPGVDLIASGVSSLEDNKHVTALEASSVAALIRDLSVNYKWVIVDTPGDLQDPEVVGALTVASVAIWAVDGDPLDLANVQNAWAKSPGEAVHCAVVMRAEPTIGVSAEAVSERLGLPVIGEIPERRSAEWTALEKGMPPTYEGWRQVAGALINLLLNRKQINIAT